MLRKGAAYKDKHGFVLGGMEGMKYQEYEIWVKPGAKLFVYTDGLPEAENLDNRMFGNQRMLDALNRVGESDPKGILEGVQNAVDSFVEGAEQFDDLTMLCLEYKGL